jgi:hypothetical protein
VSKVDFFLFNEFVSCVCTQVCIGYISICASSKTIKPPCLVMSYVGVFGMFSLFPIFKSSVLHLKTCVIEKMYDEKSIKVGLEIGIPFTWLWLSEVYVS